MDKTKMKIRVGYDGLCTNKGYMMVIMKRKTSLKKTCDCYKLSLTYPLVISGDQLRSYH